MGDGEAMAEGGALKGFAGEEGGGGGFGTGPTGEGRVVGETGQGLESVAAGVGR